MRTFIFGLLLTASTLAYADDKTADKDAKPNCHALDEGGAKITELVGAKSAMDCTKQLMTAVREAKCNDAAMTGKTVNYQQVFDAGLTAGKPIKQKLTCLKKDIKK